MTQDFFNEEELTILRNTAGIYYHVKNLLFYSEQLDDQESFLPAINEIKDSFDHLMRVFAVKFELVEGNPESIDTNLGKTYSHIYRALYDLLDYTVIFQRKLIFNKVKGISSETLAAVYPAYYQEIRPAVEISFSKISTIKENKDIGNPNTKDIEEHIVLIEKLKKYMIDIDMIMPSLIEYEKEQRKKRIKDYLILALIAFGGALVGAIITYMLCI